MCSGNASSRRKYIYIVYKCATIANKLISLTVVYNVASLEMIYCAKC